MRLEFEERTLVNGDELTNEQCEILLRNGADLISSYTEVNICKCGSIIELGERIEYRQVGYYSNPRFKCDCGIVHTLSYFDEYPEEF